MIKTKAQISGTTRQFRLITLLMIILLIVITGCRRNQNEATIRLADKLAAHPADSTKPKGVPGVSDESLRSPAAVEAAVTACVEAIQAEPQEPRYRFELGRVLLLGGMPNEAREHLEAAAQKGHPGAYYYLGQMELNTAKQFFQKAADEKFTPSEKFVRRLSSVKILQPDSEMPIWGRTAMITGGAAMVGVAGFFGWKFFRRRRLSAQSSAPAEASP